jgi:methylated-DNA-[protein]-cysteine S-methyltransferase
MPDLALVPPLPPGHPDDLGDLRFVRLHSPIGRIEIQSRLDAVERVVVDDGSGLPHDGRQEHRDDLLEAARRQVHDYFDGRRRQFDLPVRLVGTAFQRSVWAALGEVPWGVTTTYGRLGAAVGSPQAGRAVGGAVASNPVPLLVPCHRVLGRTGGVTGYTVGAGVPTKQWLLRHEGVVYRMGPVPVG